MGIVPQAREPACWHVLTESSVPVAEFAIALSRLTPVMAWLPRMSSVGMLRHGVRRAPGIEDASLNRFQFQLQRGYSRLPAKLGEMAYRRVLKMLMAHTGDPAASVLLCTSSFWAPVAAQWRGPVVYYATDFTMAYHGLSAERVLAADRAMCARADLVCPNSARLGEFFVLRAGCDREKVLVVANATRAANVRTDSVAGPAVLPAELAHIPRPIAGVIGNMGGNLDWKLLCRVMEEVPEYSWVFIGPTSDPVLSAEKRRARAAAMRWPRAHFVGSRPYRELYRYARAMDVAVLPYDRIEPTYSGSATRFYEHLAATRPMLATRGVEELLRKEPLLTLVEGVDELAAALRRLLTQPEDGRAEMRRVASEGETWECRARAMYTALQQRRSEIGDAGDGLVCG